MKKNKLFSLHAELNKYKQGISDSDSTIYGLDSLSRRKKYNQNSRDISLSALIKKRENKNYSEAKYGTGEHVLSGMVNEAHITPTYKLGVNAVDFSYGEIIAMGDLYKSHNEMMRAPKKELQRLQRLIAKSKHFYETKIITGSSSGVNATDEEWQAATKGRYLELAEDNFSHFSPTSAYLIPNFSSSKINHQKEWETYHKKAFSKVSAGVNSQDLDAALVINAFGDHFLTDAFAAGHLFNKDDLNSHFKSKVMTSGKLNSNGEKMFEKIAEKAFVGGLKIEFSKYETYEPYEAWWNVVGWNPNIDDKSRFASLLKAVMLAEPDIIGSSLIAKLVHDDLNMYQGGIPVVDGFGNSWNLTGDGTLGNTTLSKMRKAVKHSIADIVSAASREKMSYSSQVWSRTPKPTEYSQKIIRGVIKKYTDPLGDALIIGAANLLQENFKKLLDEMVKRKKLKKA